MSDDNESKRRDAGEPPANTSLGTSDRRRHPRSPVALRAKLETAAGKRVDCTILDVSSRGARVRVAEPVREGDLVKLVSPELGTSRARVMWATPGSSAGVEYVGRDGFSAAQAELPKVLLVEDEQALRELMRRILERSGYAVVPATNGREALELFRERQIDVAVTDLLMPIMDGFQLISELLTVQPSMRIIAVSGTGVRLDMARKLGAKAILWKPVTMKALIHEVGQVLSDANA